MRLHLTIGGDDRVLGAALAISILLHAGLMAVQFKRPDARSKVSDQRLEVVLVNARTRERPAKAEVLAQANLDRGGDLARRR